MKSLAAIIGTGLVGLAIALAMTPKEVSASSAYKSGIGAGIFITFGMSVVSSFTEPKTKNNQGDRLK